MKYTCTHSLLYPSAGIKRQKYIHLLIRIHRIKCVHIYVSEGIKRQENIHFLIRIDRIKCVHI